MATPSDSIPTPLFSMFPNVCFPPSSLLNRGVQHKLHCFILRICPNHFNLLSCMMFDNGSIFTNPRGSSFLSSPHPRVKGCNGLHGVIYSVVSSKSGVITWNEVQNYLRASLSRRTIYRINLGVGSVYDQVSFPFSSPLHSGANGYPATDNGRSCQNANVVRQTDFSTVCSSGNETVHGEWHAVEVNRVQLMVSLLLCGVKDYRAVAILSFI